LRENRTRERHYDFDHVFGPKSTQEEVYETVAKPLVDVVLSGFNATVFAYGQTGSGKTHTMLGSEDSPGIMCRTLDDLFQFSCKSTTFTVSFIELYNEEIRDLLNPGAVSGSGPGLDLREDPVRGPQVAGVKEVRTNTTAAVMQLVAKGNSRRRTEGTAANPVSSRSHAVLQVICEQMGKDGGGRGNGLMKCSKLSLIDLAGSERAAKTENRGQRLVEGAKINRSLLALGNCINALGKKGMYVNYRDSRLTRLLKDSLGGNTRTAMIAHCSPSASSFEETLNTLKYAHRARSIVSEVRISWKPVQKKYGEDFLQLQQEVGRLRNQLEQTSAHNLDDDDEEEISNPSRKAGSSRLPKKNQKCRRAQQEHRKPVRNADRPAFDLGITQATGEKEDGDFGYVEDGEDSILDRMENLAQTRRAVVENLREQTAIKQSLMELDDQNTRNRIEISKLQVSVMPDAVTDGQESGSVPDKENRHVATSASKGENGSALGKNGEKKKRRAKKDMHALKKAISRNGT
jgi:kinesin family protein 18/19